MALHCFNLFFPCTNILQVKCMHLSLLYFQKLAAKFATISRLRMCAKYSQGPRYVPGGGGNFGEGGVSVREAYFQPLLLAGMLAM